MSARQIDISNFCDFVEIDRRKLVRFIHELDAGLPEKFRALPGVLSIAVFNDADLARIHADFMNKPTPTVEATSENVLCVIRMNMRMILSIIPAALIEAPSVMAQNISQIVLIIPDMPRVATRSFNAGTPVSIDVLPYTIIMIPLKRFSQVSR